MKEKVQELNFDREVARFEESIFCFLKMYLFIGKRERERERESVGGQRKKFQLDSPLSPEPHTA